MSWFGHVEHSVGWISQLRKLELDSCKKLGRPKKTWNVELLVFLSLVVVIFLDNVRSWVRCGLLVGTFLSNPRQWSPLL